ncbi:UNVERIFIED_CONTAM: hypothetical protein FKN15_005855, partial [Acipenser sinensis]
KSAELRNSKKLLSKVKWSREEVIELVHKYGPKRWSVIAKHLHGRIGKQCRERWHNHLNPEVKKSLWTEEEDRVIYEAHKRLGNRWAEIAKLLPGRHATFPSKSLIVRNNSIKNHWNSTMRRKVEHEGYLQDESNSLCRSKHASKRRSKAYSHLDALQTQNQFVMAFPAQITGYSFSSADGNCMEGIQDTSVCVPHPFDDDRDKEQRIKELELLLMSAENEVGRKRVPCQSERFSSWSSSGCMTNTTVSSLEDQSVEYCRAEQPPSTAVPQQPSPSKFLAVEASAVLSSLQTIPEFAETLELIDSDPVAWSDVTSFDLSQVASPMKQTAALFPHNQECMILGYQFDDSAISDMSRNCSSSNGQMELIPLTSPVVAKFSTPPSILRRKKKERTNHSPSSEGNGTSFMDTSGVSPRNTPVKSLPFSPSQFFNISGNENFNLDNPALTSTPVCSQKYLVTTPLQKEMTPKGQKENAGFRTPKIRKSILAPTPRTPTPFKNALAAQEKKYGPLKIMHDAPARKVRKSLVLDAWEKEGLDVNLFSQDQLSNEQPPSGNLLTCSLFMTPLLDKVEGRCSPVAVKEEPSITHQHSPSVKENPCMLRSARFETPIQMNSEWETVVYGKTEDQLIMTEQARKYLNAFNSGSTSRALVL